MRLSTCLHRRCFMCGGGGGISPQLFTQIGTAEVCLENADFVLTLFIENPGDHFRIKSVVHQNLKIKVWKLKFYRNQWWSGHLSYRTPSQPNLGWSAGVLIPYLPQSWLASPSLVDWPISTTHNPAWEIWLSSVACRTKGALEMVYLCVAGRSGPKMPGLIFLAHSTNDVGRV